MKGIPESIEQSISKLRPGTDPRASKKALATLTKLAAEPQNRPYIAAIRRDLAELMTQQPSPATRAGFIPLFAQIPGITSARVLRNTAARDPNPGVRSAALEAKQTVFDALRRTMPAFSAGKSRGDMRPR